MLPPPSSSRLASHSTSIILSCLIIVGDGLLNMVVVSILVDYLDGYLSSEWLLQVVVKWTFHEVCEH